MRPRLVLSILLAICAGLSSLVVAEPAIRALPPLPPVLQTVLPAPRSVGRNKNNLTAIADAVGTHCVYRRNQRRQISTYAEYKPNPRSPSGFEMVKRVDTQHANPHTHGNVPTPHVHEKSRARPALPEELPR